MAGMAKDDSYSENTILKLQLEDFIPEKSDNVNIGPGSVLETAPDAIGLMRILNLLDAAAKDSKIKGGAKIAGGTLIALSGTEIFGRSVGIEVLRPMSKIGSFITAENIIGKGVYGVGGATGVYFAGKSMKEKGVTIGNALGMAAGATASSIGFSLSLDDVGIRSEKPMMVAAGLGLGLTSYAFAKNTIKGIEEKNYRPRCGSAKNR